MRRTSVLFRTIAAARGGSAASFTVVRNRFLQSAHYGSTTAASFTVVPNRFLQAAGYSLTRRCRFSSILGAVAAGGLSATPFTGSPSTPPFTPEVPPHALPYDVIFYSCGFFFDYDKIIAILDSYDIPYKVVEVSCFSKKEIRWSEDPEMPILMLHGEHLNGPSDAIIDKLREKILSKENADSTSQDDEETKWQQCSIR